MLPSPSYGLERLNTLTSVPLVIGGLTGDWAEEGRSDFGGAVDAIG